MRGCILQPGYLPWLGFFEQYIFSEAFVFLDDVQYTKQDWRNRNRVRTNASNGWTWLTVPVKKNISNIKINEVKIDHSQNWIKKHLDIISNNYRKTRYFCEIYPVIKETLETKHVYIADLSIDLILRLAAYLNLNRKIFRSSELNIQEQDKNLRLISICSETGITYFYDGEKAGDFLDIPLFSQHGIKVEFQRYDHPVYDQHHQPFVSHPGAGAYEQHHQPFVSHLSIADLLFNHGKESIDIIIRNPEIRTFLTEKGTEAGK